MPACLKAKGADAGELQTSDVIICFFEREQFFAIGVEDGDGDALCTPWTTNEGDSNFIARGLGDFRCEG